MIPPSALPYNFIVIEGNIGAGKTTLANKLAQTFSAGLILEEFAENSFLDKFYKNPEQYAFPLEVSFLVERFNQLQQRLSRKDLFQSLFIADYFFDKSLVFAQNNLKDDQFRLYFQLFQTFCRQIEKPDLILYLLNNVSGLQRNIRKRGRPFEMEIHDEYLEGIHENYMRYFRTLEEQRILAIDISQRDFLSDEGDYSFITGLLQKTWPAGINYIQ